MTSPATLSLADLAAAVVALGAHRGDDTLVSGNCDSGSIWIWEDIDEDACSLLLAAANRLPAVAAEMARTAAECGDLRREVDRLTEALAAFDQNSDDEYFTNPCHVCASPPGVRCPHDDKETP